MVSSSRNELLIQSPAIHLDFALRPNFVCKQRGTIGEKARTYSRSQLSPVASLSNSTPTKPAYKTKYCHQFMESGTCSYGEACQFAHGTGDLRLRMNRVVLAKPLVSRPKTSIRSNSTVKTAVGPGLDGFALRKSLHLSQKMAMSVIESVKVMNIEKEKVSVIATGSEEELSLSGRPKMQFYKTNMCKAFVARGKCSYGKECKFAHHVSELRPLPEGVEQEKTTKYKTSLCQAFMDHNFCRYGVRCQYAHGTNELRKDKQPNLCHLYASTGSCSYGSKCKFSHHRASNDEQFSSVNPASFTRQSTTDSIHIPFDSILYLTRFLSKH
jgi:hypothetical protein